MTQVMTHMITAILQRRAPVNGLSDEERIFIMILTRMAFPRTCDSLLHVFHSVRHPSIDDGLLLGLWLLLTRE